mgnify:CR=1 FL=1
MQNCNNIIPSYRTGLRLGRAVRHLRGAKTRFDGSQLQKHGLYSIPRRPLSAHRSAQASVRGDERGEDVVFSGSLAYAKPKNHNSVLSNRPALRSCGEISPRGEDESLFFTNHSETAFIRHPHHSTTYPPFYPDQTKTAL